MTADQSRGGPHDGEAVNDYLPRMDADERGSRQQKRRSFAAEEQPVELRAEFGRYVFEHEEIVEKLPSGAEIVFLPEYDRVLKDYNLKLPRDLDAPGTKVIHARFERLRPMILSRLEGLELELPACG